jgi:hypothetical protein
VKLRKTVTVTSDASGNATFNFPRVENNRAWTGTVAIPGAPATSVNTVLVEDQTEGGWNGQTPFGPVHAISQQIISVVCTGLAKSTKYTAILLGANNPANAPSPYPLPMAPSSVTSQGVVGGVPVAVTGGGGDSLGSSGAVAYPHATTGVFTVTAATGYGTIAVAPGEPNQPVAIRVNNTSKTGLRSQWQSFPAKIDYGPALMYFPVQASQGDVIQVEYTSLSGSDSAAVTIRVFGFALPVSPPTPFRSDGRLMPRGDNAATDNSGAGVTLIAAPTGAGGLARILLASLRVNSGASTAGNQSIQVTGTVNGAARVLGEAYCAGAATPPPGTVEPNSIPPQGLLLDPNTAVTTAVAVGTAAFNPLASALYDLVA